MSRGVVFKKGMGFLILFFVGGAPLFVTGLMSSEEPLISVKAGIDRAFITIGDPVEYTVTIRHQPSVQVLSYIPAPPKDIFKIKKIRDIHQTDGDAIIEGKRFTLTTFRLGEFILDPVKIEYRIEGDEPQELETGKIFLTVKSVAQGEVKKDIRGMKTVMGIPRQLLGLFVFISLLGVAAIGFWIYQRMRSPRESLEDQRPRVSPEEEALTRLHQLFDSDLIRRGHVKSYYGTLSEVIRIYLERRFGIMAIEYTTGEINRSLKSRDLELPLREVIREVLESADLAKFAKWKPEPSIVIRLNKKSEQIIEASRPREGNDGV